MGACEQLVKVKRLCKVVVSAAVEACDPILHRVACGQHEYRDSGTAFAKLAADGNAILLRQHDVQDYQVVTVHARLVERILSVIDGIDGICLLTKAFASIRAARRLRQQDSHIKPYHRQPSPSQAIWSAATLGTGRPAAYS
jgi:hypothetical protein